MCVFVSTQGQTSTVEPRLYHISYILIFEGDADVKHSWCSGNIGSSHGLAPGSTPGGCIHIASCGFFLFWACFACTPLKNRYAAVDNTLSRDGLSLGVHKAA